jgi:hypothetical protein
MSAIAGRHTPAELTGLVHLAELTALDMIAKLKGQSLALVLHPHD